MVSLRKLGILSKTNSNSDTNPQNAAILSKIILYLQKRTFHERRMRQIGNVISSCQCFVVSFDAGEQMRKNTEEKNSFNREHKSRTNYCQLMEMGKLRKNVLSGPKNGQSEKPGRHSGTGIGTLFFYNDNAVVVVILSYAQVNSVVIR